MTPSATPILQTRLPRFGAHKAAATRHEQLVHQTERLVSQTFYGTLLKQMRDSPFKSKLFDGGRGGEAFSTLLDQHLADHMARGAGGKLVDSIVRHIEHAGTRAAAADVAARYAGQSQVKRAIYSAPSLSNVHLPGRPGLKGK